jgi:hypothetical protein
MPSIINATTSTGLVTTADNSGSLQLATNNGTTAVTIDTSQNVGVGTTSPAVKFEVSGTVVASGLNARITNTDTDASARAGIQFKTGASANVWQTFTRNNQLVFGINAVADYMAIDGSGNLQFNSGYGSSAIAYGCRAWVNFNGDTAGSPAIRASGNVSSLTDNGAGRYAVNFTNAMPDANYGANVSVSGQPGVSDAMFITTDQNNTVRVNPTTSSFAMTAFRFQGSPLDADFVRVSIFR